MDGQRLPTLGGLQGTDVRAPYQPQQVTWGQSSRSGRYLEEDVGEVCVGGDESGVQGILQDGTAL